MQWTCCLSRLSGQHPVTAFSIHRHPKFTCNPHESRHMAPQPCWMHPGWTGWDPGQCMSSLGAWNRAVCLASYLKGLFSGSGELAEHVCSYSGRVRGEGTPEGAGHWAEMILSMFPATSALLSKNSSHVCTSKFSSGHIKKGKRKKRSKKKWVTLILITFYLLHYFHSVIISAYNQYNHILSELFCIPLWEPGL